MLRVNNIVKVLTLSTVMFGAGATVATVALSYLPMVNASSTKIAQGLKQSKLEQIDEENNLNFKFQDCKRSGKNVLCSVLATNLKNENQYIFFQGGGGIKTRVIDVDGNQYMGRQLVNGKQESGWISTNFIYNIPTKITFSFEIPREVTKLAVLEHGYAIALDNSGNTKDGKVALRDINISGSQASNPANPGSDCTSPPQTTPKKPRPR